MGRVKKKEDTRGIDDGDGDVDGAARGSDDEAPFEGKSDVWKDRWNVEGGKEDERRGGDARRGTGGPAPEPG